MEKNKKENKEENIEKENSINKNKISSYWIIGLCIVISALISASLTYGVKKDKDILGFLGSIIGVLGTYGAFYLGEVKERKKEEEKKIQEKEFALQSLYYMLNNSIQKTAEPVENIINKYISASTSYTTYSNYYKSKKVKRFIKSTVPKDEIVMNKIQCDFKFLWEDIDLNSFKDTKDMDDDEIKELEIFKRDIENYLKSIDFSYLIYDKDWYKHIYKLSDTYAFEIIEWVNILKYNQVENAYKFLEKRNWMIQNITDILNNPLIKGKCGNMHASDIAHNYKKTYEDKIKNEEMKIKKINQRKNKI